MLMLFSALFFVLSMNIASAEEAILPTVDETDTTALTITPSIYEGAITQGETTSQIFELRNNSHVPLPIKCYTRNFDANGEEGGVSIPEEEDSKRFSPRSWIEVVSADFVIQPQTIRQITVNFHPPKDLPPGGYYAILFAEPLLPESFIGDSSLKIGGRLGSLFFLISPGDTSEKGKITSADFPRYIFSSTPPELKIHFQNEGNVHLRPSGKIVVTNLITKKSRDFEVPEFTVLPGKVRQSKVLLSNLRWPGYYRGELELKYGKEQTRAGASANFWYLPWPAIFVIIVMALIAVLAISRKARGRIIRAVCVIIRNKEK